MGFKKRVLAGLALSLAICTDPATAHAADDGLDEISDQATK